MLDKPLRHVPESGGITRIESVGGIATGVVGRTLCDLFCFVAVFEITTAYAVQQRRRCQQDGCCCALFNCLATLDGSFQAACMLLKPSRDSAGDFSQIAGLEAIAARSEKLGIKKPNCLSKLDDLKVDLPLLFINGHNTTGLEGDPNNPASKFYRFLLLLGDGGKEHDEHGMGGSYGFGKAVYSKNSGIVTIFAYSRTVDEKKKPMSLPFGCGYHHKHTVDQTFYTGRAWFGLNDTPDVQGGLQKVSPLRDAEADRIAVALGFDVRADCDLGTSVLIVDAMLDAEAVLSGIEEWWWPRLIDNQLDARVSAPDKPAMLPRPRKRDDLRPFLDAYEIATGKSPPSNKSDFRKTFIKSEGYPVGNVGFKVLQINKDDQYDVHGSRVEDVALIRSTLMVVTYHRGWREGSPAVAPAIDDICERRNRQLTIAGIPIRDGCRTRRSASRTWSKRLTARSGRSERRLWIRSWRWARISSLALHKPFSGEEGAARNG